MKCCVCEIHFQICNERKIHFPESLTPETCDKCCVEIIESKIKKYIYEIKKLKEMGED